MENHPCQQLPEKFPLQHREPLRALQRSTAVCAGAKNTKSLAARTDITTEKVSPLGGIATRVSRVAVDNKHKRF
jgi:hypothetical protein